MSRKTTGGNETTGLLVGLDRVFSPCHIYYLWNVKNFIRQPQDGIDISHAVWLAGIMVSPPGGFQHLFLSEIPQTHRQRSGCARKAI